MFNYFKNIQKLKSQIREFTQILPLIEYYFLFYIDFNYILKQKERNNHSSEIENFLNYLEKNILQFEPNIDKNKLEDISETLDLFKEEKSSHKARRIISYILLVLYSLEFWKRNVLKKQIKKIFPGNILRIVFVCYLITINKMSFDPVFNPKPNIRKRERI